jgi:Family of unknown function (DUF6427)
VTGIFKANNPSNNFFLLLYGLALKLPLFLYPSLPALQSSDGPLYSSIMIWLKGTFSGAPVIFSFISFTLLFVQAIFFNKVVNDQRMLQKPNYLIAMAYLLITSLFSEWFALSAALMVNTALIWVWSKLCSMHNNNSAKSAIYNTGLVIGVACFFYYPSILFSILFMAGIAITRPFKLNEWLIALLGMLTAFYFFACWIFLTGQWNTYLWPHVKLSVPFFVQTRWAIAAVVLILLSMMLGLFFIQNNKRRQVVQTRKSWQLIYIYLVVTALVPFVNAANSFNSFILMAVPVSLITGSAFFYPDKKWFPLLIHWSMAAICIAVAYFVR